MVEDYPSTMEEMESRFADEAACREYLFRLRWPAGFVCPGCGTAEAWALHKGLWQCHACRRQVSVTAGTVFDGSHLPLPVWFRAMWQITSQKNGISALGLQRALGIGSYHTAWEWLYRLRHAMVRPNRDRISGIIEVDEIYIGGKKTGKRGRGAEGKVLVVIAAQIDGNRIGRIRLKRVSDAS